MIKTRIEMVQVSKTFRNLALQMFYESEHSGLFELKDAQMWFCERH